MDTIAEAHRNKVWTMEKETSKFFQRTFLVFKTPAIPLRPNAPHET